MIRNESEWERAGRGKELQFFATDAEITGWLNALPPTQGPYALLVEELVKLRPGKFESRAEVIPLNEVQREIETGARFPYWIVPTDLVPVDDLLEYREPAVAASLSGCVMVYHRSKGVIKQNASRIALVDKLRHLQSGALVTNEAGLAIFKTLQRMIKPQLKYSTVRTLRNGKTEEDRKHILMTEAAATRGEYARQPGQQL
ncbi:MAG: hypothetical protein H7A21_04250 [Spirochaetales bacterium]|nr:hypothetical protein [Leptospiraceae bacterium]MCP5480625.1 hypothetical protein [Spirochaetales bacterium]MCP5483977.1 hypothetical protein [Spirochaetales bacterium]